METHFTPLKLFFFSDIVVKKDVYCHFLLRILTALDSFCWIAQYISMGTVPGNAHWTSSINAEQLIPCVDACCGLVRMWHGGFTILRVFVVLALVGIGGSCSILNAAVKMLNKSDLPFFFPPSALLNAHPSVVQCDVTQWFNKAGIGRLRNMSCVSCEAHDGDIIRRH